MLFFLKNFNDNLPSGGTVKSKTLDATLKKKTLDKGNNNDFEHPPAIQTSHG